MQIINYFNIKHLLIKIILSQSFTLGFATHIHSGNITWGISSCAISLVITSGWRLMIGILNAPKSTTHEEKRLTKLPMQEQMFSQSSQFHYIRLQDRRWMLRCLCAGDDVLLNCMIPANRKGRSCNCKSHLFTYRCITCVVNNE